MLYPYNFLLCVNAIDPISHKFSLCWYNDLLYPIGSDQPGAPRPPSCRFRSRSRFVRDAQFSNGQAPAPLAALAPAALSNGPAFGNGPAAPARPKSADAARAKGTGIPPARFSTRCSKCQKSAKTAPPTIFDSLFKMSKKCSPEILNTFPPTAQKHPRKNFEHFSGKAQKTPLPQYWTKPPANPKKAPLNPSATPPQPPITPAAASAPHLRAAHNSHSATAKHSVTAKPPHPHRLAPARRKIFHSAPGPIPASASPRVRRRRAEGIPPASARAHYAS